MVKVFYDQGTLKEDFAKELQIHDKVYYSKEWDAYLIESQDYEEVFKELNFDKQCELDTNELLDWQNIKIMSINEMIGVQYEQEYVTVLKKEFSYDDVASVDDEEIIDLFNSEDWGIEVDELIKVKMAAMISEALSDTVDSLKSKGFEIVLS